MREVSFLKSRRRRNDVERPLDDNVCIDSEDVGVLLTSPIQEAFSTVFGQTRRNKSRNSDTRSGHGASVPPRLARGAPRHGTSTLTCCPGRLARYTICHNRVLMSLLCFLRAHPGRWVLMPCRTYPNPTPCCTKSWLGRASVQRPDLMLVADSELTVPSNLGI